MGKAQEMKELVENLDQAQKEQLVNEIIDGVRKDERTKTFNEVIEIVKQHPDADKISEYVTMSRPAYMFKSGVVEELERARDKGE